MRVAVALLLTCACTRGDEGPRVVHAPAGDVAVAVRDHDMSNATRRTLVYVGASWCEPCTRLKEAIAAHQVDDVLADVDLVEFDLDVDRERLEAAGYGSRMIPLLAVPDANGRGTSARMEGSIKGAGAVAEMKPRIAALLAGKAP
jgi:hypothetical protein